MARSLARDHHSEGAATAAAPLSDAGQITETNGTPSDVQSPSALADPGEVDADPDQNTTASEIPEESSALLRAGPAARPSDSQSAANTETARPRALAAAAASLSTPDAPPETTTTPAGSAATNWRTSESSSAQATEPREPSTATREPGASAVAAASAGARTEDRDMQHPQRTPEVGQQQKRFYL